jgi:uncharacterized protein (DUF1330 family)
VFVQLLEETMTAYVIAEARDITDEAAYQRYRPLGASALAQHHGQYLIRGGAALALEGDWQPQKLSILQFPSVELAQAWYDSPEYRNARAVREGAVRMRFVAVDGASS